jgi:phospholipid/cholesterol/gamma-HCH transport system substrate-binding protein
MNTTPSQKLKIGIFVVVGFLILIAGIFLIGSKKNMFSSTYKIYGTFRNAGGLQVGNNVRFGGVNIGTVKAIQIVKDTLVRVDMIIQSKMSEFIKNDAVATVGSDGLMGDKLLTIEPGTPNAGVLSPGSKIRTAEPVDFATIINKFSNVATNAEVITGALAGMALQIKNGDGSISRLLYRNDLAVGLEGVLNNAKGITGSMNGIANHIKSGQGSLGSLIYTDSLSKGLEHTVASANAALVTVQVAADNFSENMRALQGNYFFRGYFKKKAKAQADSLKAGAEEENDVDDAELEKIREDADKELKRRQQGATTPRSGN